MAVPATTGQLKNNLQDMEIGDYIAMNAKPNYQFGTGGLVECPLSGVRSGASVSNYYWYMIKVDKGLLISDRVWIHTMSWDAINNNKAIEGLYIPSIDGYIRSLTGGIAYTDMNGEMSLNQINAFNGAFPLENEYDTYIAGFPPSLLQQGKTTDDVFNNKSMFTLCRDTPINGVWKNVSGATVAVNNTQRMRRGYDGRTDNDWKNVTVDLSNVAWEKSGFRPVFEYKEG